MSERRPRIDDDLAARIDAARGDVPFERYVRNVLDDTLGGIQHEKDPDAKGHRLLGTDGSVLADGLTKRQAEGYAYVLNLAARAYNVAWELVAELQDDELLDKASGAADALHAIGNDLADRLNADTGHGIPAGRSPSTGRRLGHLSVRP